MDRADFAAHAAAFAARPAAARDGWRWNAVPVGTAAAAAGGRDGEGYLSKEKSNVDVDLSNDEDEHAQHENEHAQHENEHAQHEKAAARGSDDAVDAELLEDDASDIATLRIPSTGNVGRLQLQMTYHVLWSPVYAVPVMYLFCTHSSGQPADLATVQRALQRLGGGVDLGSATNFPSVLLEEHPLLHVPAYCLHPCGTPQLLQDAAAVAANTNPIVTWLSFVGPQVGLRIPLAYLLGS